MLRALVTVLCLAALALPAGADQVRPNYVSPGGNTGQPRTGSSGGKFVDPPSGADGSSYQEECHPYVARHFVPEFGRVVRHRHVGPACRPMMVDPDDLERAYSSDCHRDVRRHRLPRSNDPVLHRHVGDDCKVRIIRRSTDG